MHMQYAHAAHPLSDPATIKDGDAGVYFQGGGSGEKAGDDLSGQIAVADVQLPYLQLLQCSSHACSTAKSALTRFAQCLQLVKTWQQ
jgi:hypothetical protein